MGNITDKSIIVLRTVSAFDAHLLALLSYSCFCFQMNDSTYSLVNLVVILYNFQLVELISFMNLIPDNTDAQKIEQTTRWRGLDLEQPQYIVLGHWIYFRVYGGGAGWVLFR